MTLIAYVAGEILYCTFDERQVCTIGWGESCSFVGLSVDEMFRPKIAFNSQRVVVCVVFTGTMGQA